MSFVHDEERLRRLNMPEAIYCAGKDARSLEDILTHLTAGRNAPILFTHLTSAQFAGLAPAFGQMLDYDALSRTAILHGSLPPRSGSVVVITAGTSDLPVAREAARTLSFTGIANTMIADVGVAGIHRLFERLDEIRQHDVVIVVAGWDAALASVIGGLVSQPVIAVPTSVGYGVAAGGTVALNAMLASCGQGVLVTNIDNGFGAACGAIRMLGQR